MNEIDHKISRAQACPICGRPADRTLRPFCSRRCADIDLHRWLSGVYAMPVEDDQDLDGEHSAERETGEG